MAIDSYNKRASAIMPGCPWRSMWPFPDGEIGARDRRVITGLYYLTGIPGADSVGMQTAFLKAGRVYRISGWLRHDGTSGSGRGVALNINPGAGQTLTILERQGYDMAGVPEPDVGIEAGASPVDWTFVYSVFTPDIDGTIQVYPQFGYDGNLVGVARFADIRCVELPANSTVGGRRAFNGIDDDGGMYVPPGQTILVGTLDDDGGVTAGYLRKKIRIPAAAFKGRTSSTSYTIGSSGSYIHPNSTAQQFMVAAAILPVGVIVREIIAGLYRDTTNGTSCKTEVKAYSLGAAGAITGTLATLTHTSTGAGVWQTVAVTTGINYVVSDSEGIAMDLELNMGGLSPSDGARLAYVDVAYDVPDYAKSI